MTDSKDQDRPSEMASSKVETVNVQTLAAETTWKSGRIVRLLDSLGWSERTRAWQKLAAVHASLPEIVILFEVVRSSSGEPSSYRAVRVNRVFARMAHCKPEQAVDVLNSLLHDKGTVPFLDKVSQLFREGRTEIWEFNSLKLERHFRVSAFLPGGRDLFAVLASDITAQKERDDEILRINRYYSVLSQINQVIVRTSNSEDLLRQVCQAFVDKGLLGYAWAGLKNSDSGYPDCVAQWAASSGLVARTIHTDPGYGDSSVTVVALNENRISVFNNLVGDQGVQGWGDAAVQLGFLSAAAFPLRKKGAPAGTITLYSREKNAFSAREVNLLKAASEEISYAFDNCQKEIERIQAQSDLKRSELRYRRLFEQSPVSYLTLDSEARILDANPAWHTMLGERDAERSSRVFSDHLAPVFRESFNGKFKAFIASKRDRSMEVDLIGNDGRRVSAIFEMRVEVDILGTFKQAHCVVFDVSERKEFEAALQASEERLTLAFELASDGIWDMDLRTGEGYLSHRYYTMLGYVPGEFPGGLDHWRSLIHPDDFPGTEAVFQNFLESEASEFVCEHRMRARDSSWKWVLCRGKVAEKDKDGKKLRVLGTNSDVTARKAAEEALRETAQRYSSYISESPLSILALDDHGAVNEANPASTTVFGYPENELRAHTFLNLLESTSTASGKRMLAQLLKTGKTEGEVRGRRKNGALLYLSLVGATVSPKRHLLFCQDVTSKRRTELALQSREAMLESILHTALDGFWIVDMEGRLLEVNESYCKLSGYTHKELLQMRILDLEVIEDLQSIQQHIERIRRMGCDRWETSHRRKDGALLDIEISATYITLEGGRIVVFLQNITERKRAENELRQSQKRLSLIIEGSSLAAWDWNLATDEIVFNGYWARLMGCGEEEMSLDADVFRKMLHPDDAARVKNHYLAHFEGRQTYIDCEYRLRRKNGSWVWIMDRGQVIARDAAGKPLRATGTQRDVTARHLAQERVRQQAALLDQTRDIVFATDVNGVLLYCNHSAEVFLDSSFQNSEGQILSSLLTDAQPQFGPDLLRTVLSNGEWRGEITFEAGSRAGQIWDSRWSVVPATEGEARIVLMVNTDVTEKRMMESRFLKSQRMESIGSLATGISHDLNNIFLPISLTLRMLREETNAEKREALFSMLDKSAQRGADIVNQLVIFSKGADGQRIELQPRTLLTEVQKFIAETFPKNITLQTQFPEDLWSIEADPTQINQVLINLCVNARDAMPDGGTLALSGENILFDEHYATMNPDADAGPYIVLVVGDTGVGIPPERLEKIFDPFFTTKGEGKGSGLGLSTAHGIVKSHGGFIQVRSKPGQGSSFKIYFPAMPTLVTVEEEPAFAEIPPANGETILVVDDEEAIRETLRHMLENQGYRTLIAADGRQGMVCFVQQRARIKALVTDIMMPVMDGTELIRAVRSVDPRLPIVAMSGLPEKELSTTNAGVRPDHFLIKPFVSEQLLYLLHQHMQAGVSTSSAGTFAASGKTH